MRIAWSMTLLSTACSFIHSTHSVLHFKVRVLIFVTFPTLSSPILDIFYFAVVVVVTLLALAVLILIEFTEHTELKLLRKSMRRTTIDIGSFFDDGANLIDNNVQIK